VALGFRVDEGAGEAGGEREAGWGEPMGGEPGGGDGGGEGDIAPPLFY
jgi:hypothetical protein